MQQALAVEPRSIFITAADGSRREIVALMHERIEGLGVAVSIGDEGKIIVPRWMSLETLFEPGEDWRVFQFKPEHRQLFLVQSVFHAFRQAWHILYQSGFDTPWSGEKALMRGALDEARRLNTEILALAPGATVSEVRMRTERSISRMMASLGAARKLSKREALGQLEAIEEGTDSRGRVNAPAAAARSVSSMNLLEERYRELCRIDPKIMERQQIFRQMILSAKYTLGRVSDFVLQLAANHSSWRQGPAESRVQLGRWCEYFARVLEELDYNPYRVMCSLTAVDLRLVRDILNHPLLVNLDRDRVLAILARCRAALEIKRQQTEVERLIFRLTQHRYRIANPQPVASLRRKLEEIIRELRSIDESGLQFKVCAKAMQQLQLTLSFLEAGTGGRLEAARNCLKQASALL